MERKQIDEYLRRFYKRKSISLREYNMVVSILQEFKDVDPYFYNFNMGKFITAFGKAIDAIPYLEKAKGFDEAMSSIYYNLYKCNVRLSNYEEAISNLCLCKEKYEKEADFSLPLQMMRSLVDMKLDFDEYRRTDYVVESTNMLYFNRFDDNETLNKTYSQIVKAFNDKDFEKLVSLFNSMKMVVEDENYPVDVDTLVIIANELKKTMRMKNVQKTVVCDNSDMELSKYLESVKTALVSYNAPVRRFLVEADNCVSTDLEKAEGIVKLISELGYLQCGVELNYLKNKILEEKEYRGLPEEVRKEYDKFQEEGKEAFRTKRFELAEQKYRKAFEVANLSISNYYIGKALFKQKKFYKAREYFLKYVEQGGAKYDKCLLYLGVISNNFKQQGIARKYFLTMERLNDSFARDFQYNGPGSTFSISKKEKDDDEFDRRKHKVSTSVKISEEEVSSEELMFSPEYFYDYDLNGKLEVIKQFLRSGQDDIANKLLSDLGLLSKDERAKVSQFQKNKKIYSNQKRTN